MTLKLKASAFAVAAAVSLGAASTSVSAQEQRFVTIGTGGVPVFIIRPAVRSVVW